MADDQDLELEARSRAEHMPGETAGGRVDDTGVTPGDTGDSAAAGPPEGGGRVTGVDPQAAQTLMGDESTGGEAAEESIGARAGESGTEIDDRTRS